MKRPQSAGCTETSRYTPAPEHQDDDALPFPEKVASSPTLEVIKNLARALGVSADPSDNMFLACALESETDFIVSRDPHLRNLKQYQGVKIVDVKAILEAMSKG